MKRFVSSAVFFCLMCAANAQYTEPADTDSGSRISFGGNFDIGFGDVTSVTISPLIGYKLNPKFTLGVGGIFQYLKYHKNAFGFELKTITFGERLFGRYLVYKNFFAVGEYQNLHLEIFDENRNRSGRINVPVFLIGGGYLVHVAGNTYLGATLMFDVIEDTYSPYSNPLIQMGVIVNP